MLKSLLSHQVDEVSVKDVTVDANTVFIDSREKKEFDVSHLPNAIWVGYDQLNLAPLDNIDKNQKIIVYCSIGFRSEKVCMQLKEKGFTNVFNLYGGIFEWKNQEKKVVDQSGTATEKVHAYSPAWGIWLTKGEKVY